MNSTVTSPFSSMVPSPGYAAGLCSVSFRDLPPEQVVALAVENGLVGIEWGSDVHVPVGDLTAAAHVRALSLAAGLDPASYGTYLRTGDGNAPAHLAEIAETAAALGVANIRIWGGPRGVSSNDATSAIFEAAVSETRAIANLAAERGMTVSLEFHADTLVDTGPAANRLLRAVGHDMLFLYWQPTPGISLATSQAEIALIAPKLSHVHVFNRNEHHERGLVAEQAAFWKEIFANARPAPAWRSVPYAMIEFVKDDDPANLRKDAVFLRNLI